MKYSTPKGIKHNSPDNTNELPTALKRNKKSRFNLLLHRLKRLLYIYSLNLSNLDNQIA